MLTWTSGAAGVVRRVTVALVRGGGSIFVLIAIVMAIVIAIIDFSFSFSSLLVLLFVLMLIFGEAASVDEGAPDALSETVFGIHIVLGG